MKLIFANTSLRKRFKDVTRMTFDITQHELGLTDNPTMILLTLGNGFDSIFPMGDGLATRAGSTEKPDEDGFVRIELTPNEVQSMMKTLCHEMVHVCQDLTGTLEGDESDGMVHYIKWRGEDYSKQLKAAKDDFKAYEALPWEKQARNMATKIFPKVDAEFHKRWPDGL